MIKFILLVLNGGISGNNMLIEQLQILNNQMIKTINNYNKNLLKLVLNNGQKDLDQLIIETQMVNMREN